jgi:hypothetical protein
MYLKKESIKPKNRKHIAVKAEKKVLRIYIRKLL